MRLIVFEEGVPAHEQVLRLCGQCRTRFRTDGERNEYLEAAVLA